MSEQTAEQFKAIIDASAAKHNIPNLHELFDVAIKQLEFAYIPYSNYPVGCALLCPDGKIIGGSNIEVASYPVGICAERSALSAAASQGYRSFDAVIVVTRDGGTCCGMCRQFLREFLHPKDKKPIFIIKPNREIIHETHIDEILPNSFGPENLLGKHPSAQ